MNLNFIVTGYINTASLWKIWKINNKLISNIHGKINEKKDGNTQGFDQIYYECITMISLKFISSNYQVPHRILNIFWASNNRSVTLKSPQLHSSLFLLLEFWFSMVVFISNGWISDDYAPLHCPADDRGTGFPLDKSRLFFLSIDTITS